MPVQNQHPEDIKARIRKQGATLTSVGDAYDVKPTTISKSLRVPCPKGNVVIADFLGVRLYDLWPEWYDARNKRLHPTDDIRSALPRHCQKRRAA